MIESGLRECQGLFVLEAAVLADAATRWTGNVCSGGGLRYTGIPAYPRSSVDRAPASGAGGGSSSLPGGASFSRSNGRASPLGLTASRPCGCWALAPTPSAAWLLPALRRLSQPNASARWRVRSAGQATLPSRYQQTQRRRLWSSPFTQAHCDARARVLCNAAWQVRWAASSSNRGSRSSSRAWASCAWRWRRQGFAWSSPMTSAHGNRRCTS